MKNLIPQETIVKNELHLLPRSPGVYLFYHDQSPQPLYIGKSIDIQKRVKSHYQQAKSNKKENKIMRATQHIGWQCTVGEIEALLLEAKLVKKLSPLYNRKLRRLKYLYSIRLNSTKEFLLPEIFGSNSESIAINETHYGLFRSKRQALQCLESIAQQYRLCKKMLGLEHSQRQCFGYQLQQCAGACCGQQTASSFNQQLKNALLNIRQRTWPFSGMIGIVEAAKNDTAKVVHLVNHWRYYGTFQYPQNSYSDIDDHTVVPFDLDSYKIICHALHHPSENYNIVENIL